MIVYAFIPGETWEDRPATPPMWSLPPVRTWWALIRDGGSGKRYFLSSNLWIVLQLAVEWIRGGDGHPYDRCMEDGGCGRIFGTFREFAEHPCPVGIPSAVGADDILREHILRKNAARFRGRVRRVEVTR